MPKASATDLLPAIYLVVPGIALPGTLLHDLSFDLPLPGLRSLLGEGHLATRSLDIDLANPLLAASVHPSSLPAPAALRRLGLGLPADDHLWLCVDPVHLGFRERSVIVHDPAQLGLILDDAQEIAVSLAPTFANLGELYVDSPVAWHLKLHRPAPHFTPLETAVSAPAMLGLSEDKSWNVVLNDVQMLLHRHPVNRRREALQLPAINSLWPWGNGPTLGSMSLKVPTVSRLLANNLCLRGFALHLEQAAETLPAQLPLDLVTAKEIVGDTIMVLDHLAGASRSGDAQSWRDALVTLDTEWFKNLSRAWQSGQANHRPIHVIFPGTNAAHWLTLAPHTWQSRLARSVKHWQRRLLGNASSAQLDQLANPVVK